LPVNPRIGRTGKRQRRPSKRPGWLHGDPDLAGAGKNTFARVIEATKHSGVIARCLDSAGRAG
jgi:hypothetical protein